MAIDKWGRWDGKTESNVYNPQMTGGGGAQAPSLTVQGSSPNLQPTINTSGGNQRALLAPTGASQVSGVNTGYEAPAAVDPAVAAAAAKAAEDARKAGILRGETTNIINRVKDIFNSRYGQIDASAAEQAGSLDTRYNTESSDITRQVTDENNALGAAHAASGTFDSSYRGNNVDTVTKAGEGQIRDLGTELQDNRAKIGAWASKEKAGFDAQKSGLDMILNRLAETTDLGELTQLRNSIEAKQAELQASSADNNVKSQSLATLASIAPSNARAVQLKTTLSSIVAGNADKGTKSRLGN